MRVREARCEGQVGQELGSGRPGVGLMLEVMVRKARSEGQAGLV
jgi:hypothetical protein